MMLSVSKSLHRCSSRSLLLRGCSSQRVSCFSSIPYEKLTVGIPKEDFPLEKRVAATPESVQRLVKPGFQVQVQKGAGVESFFNDKAYEEAGATIVDDVWKSDIVLKVSIIRHSILLLHLHTVLTFRFTCSFARPLWNRLKSWKIAH